MRRSGSTTNASSAVSQLTKPVTLEERPTMNHTESTRTKPSKISQITEPLKKASLTFDQKLQKLRSRVTKSKAVGEENEKPASLRTSSPKAVKEQTGEGGPAVDAEKTSKDEAKKTRPDARRDSRRAKWAAMRKSLKKLGRLAGKAALFTGAVILGFIFGPILVVFELVMSLVVIVIGLLLQLVEILCTPCLICFDW